MNKPICVTSSIAGLILFTWIYPGCRTWVKDHDFKTFDEAIHFALSSKIITIVYYARPLPKGTRLERSDLRVEFKWQPKYPQDAITDPKEVIGRTVVYAIPKDAMVGYADVGLGGKTKFFQR